MFSLCRLVSGEQRAGRGLGETRVVTSEYGMETWRYYWSALPPTLSRKAAETSVHSSDSDDNNEAPDGKVGA